MDILIKALYGFGGATIVAMLGILLVPVRRWMLKKLALVRSFFRARKQIDRMHQVVSGTGIWLAEPIIRPDVYDSFFADPTPTLTVANLKGGVGKTTAAVNLAAYFAAERDERVLFIDLDFQGSASSMLLTREHRIPKKGEFSKASKIVAGEIKPRHLNDFATPVRSDQMKEAWAIPAYYDLASVENRELVYWLSGKKVEDVRYALSMILSEANKKKQFDRVIIDAPPRLTTATVQALCASTHVLIPTRLDSLSGEAVGSFVREIVDRRELLWPYLKFAGVSGQLVKANISKWRDMRPDEDFGHSELIDQLTVSERAGLASISSSLKRLREEYGNKMPKLSLLPPETFIADRSQIAESAGRSVAFFDIDGELKAMFRKLGQEVEIRMSRDEIY